MSRFTRIKRRGEQFSNSNRRLPPTQERVLRTLGLRELFSPLADRRPRGIGLPLQDVPRTWGPEAPQRINVRRLSPRPAKPAVSYHKSMVRGINSLFMRVPTRVSFCVRRKQRREVLFARNVAGRRGVGYGKHWRRTQDSQYTC